MSLNKFYCSVCAFTNVGYKKPSFCQQCGNPLGAGLGNTQQSNKPSKPVVQRPARPYIHPSQTDDNDSPFYETPEVEAFVIEHMEMNKANQVTIKDVIDNPAPPSIARRRERPKKSKSSKTIVKNFLADLGKPVRPIDIG